MPAPSAAAPGRNERTLGLSESEALAAAAGRALQLDRELAGALQRAHRALEVGSESISALSRRGPLTRDDELALARAAKAGDARARAGLIAAFLPQIVAESRHYRGSGLIDRLELVQEGAAGLLQAIERYDADGRGSFWTHARGYVRHNMRRLVAELTEPVVLSDRALRQLSEIRDAHERFVLEHHREPSTSDLAEASGLPREQVAHLLVADRPPQPVQQTAVPFDPDARVAYAPVVDELAEGEYERVLDAVDAEELASLLSSLSDRERTVLRWRYGLDGAELGPQEIARRLGLSTRRVLEIERRARAKLAAAAGSQETG